MNETEITEEQKRLWKELLNKVIEGNKVHRIILEEILLKGIPDYYPKDQAQTIVKKELADFFSFCLVCRFTTSRKYAEQYHLKQRQVSNKSKLFILNGTAWGDGRLIRYDRTYTPDFKRLDWEKIVDLGVKI